MMMMITVSVTTLRGIFLFQLFYFISFADLIQVYTDKTKRQKNKTKQKSVDLIKQYRHGHRNSFGQLLRARIFGLR